MHAAVLTHVGLAARVEGIDVTPASFVLGPAAFVGDGDAGRSQGFHPCREIQPAGFVLQADRLAGVDAQAFGVRRVQDDAGLPGSPGQTLVVGVRVVQPPV